MLLQPFNSWDGYSTLTVIDAAFIPTTVGFAIDCCSSATHFRRGNKRHPLFRMDRNQGFQSYMAVNARTRIPAAIYPFIFYFHGHYIRLVKFDVISKIKNKTGIAIRMIAKVITVDPHIRIHINSIKLKMQFFTFHSWIDSKRFAIPPAAAGGKSDVCLADRIPVKR
ncbi:MAG: hypothetical protein JWP81_1730 [Ferruginibacter sp.]|nr:hypothetical protein [Ferruginibacter sp.]